jgi:uncharacterized C2H2 Zn-finger protein
MTVVTPYDSKEKRCPVCGRVFASRAELAEHMRRDHPGVLVSQG